MSESPSHMRTSTAAAMTLKYLPGKFYRGAKLSALNLLLTYEDGCKARCAYCGLSRTRDVGETFIRVDWPSFSLDDIIDRTKKHGSHLRRVCVSMITHPRAFEDLCFVVQKFKKETSLRISALITPTSIRNKEMLQRIKDSGADMVGIAIDAATKELFEKLRGERVKGPHKWRHYWNAVEQSVEIFGRYNAGIHLIVGLGETEEEMVKTIQMAHDIGAKTHLFSFYPEDGSDIQDWKQPPYGQYRRIQLARYIINKGHGRYDDMRFNRHGQITNFGLDTSKIISAGEAFMTSGCPGEDGKVACNRPFANERPSRPIRNFAFLPNSEDIELIKTQIVDYS